MQDEFDAEDIDDYDLEAKITELITFLGKCRVERVWAYTVVSSITTLFIILSTIIFRIQDESGFYRLLPLVSAGGLLTLVGIDFLVSDDCKEAEIRPRYFFAISLGFCAILLYATATTWNPDVFPIWVTQSGFTLYLAVASCIHLDKHYSRAIDTYKQKLNCYTREEKQIKSLYFLDVPEKVAWPFYLRNVEKWVRRKGWLPAQDGYYYHYNTPTEKPYVHTYSSPNTDRYAAPVKEEVGPYTRTGLFIVFLLLGFLFILAYDISIAFITKQLLKISFWGIVFFVLLGGFGLLVFGSVVIAAILRWMFSICYYHRAGQLYFLGLLLLNLIVVFKTAFNALTENRNHPAPYVLLISALATLSTAWLFGLANRIEKQ